VAAAGVAAAGRRRGGGGEAQGGQVATVLARATSKEEADRATVELSAGLAFIRQMCPLYY
jgi:hypothetical protein